MKKFLLAFYLGLVVLLSLNARAQQMTVESIQVNKSHHVLEVLGYFSNPCISNPKPMLTATEQADTFHLEIVGSSDALYCVQVLGPKMALAIDYKSLKFELERSGVRADKKITLINKESGFETVIDFSQDMLAQNFPTTTVIGSLKEKDGRFYIEVTSNKDVEAISPFIELTPMLGASVKVFGHVFTRDLSKSPFDMSKNSNHQILLTGVSIATK